MVILIKKFFTSILALSSLKENSIIVTLATIFGIYTILFMRFKPFLNPILNYLEYFACFCLFLGIFIDALIHQSNPDNFGFLLFLNVMLFLSNLYISFIGDFNFYFI